MFAPDQERAAAELLRVCRPGGRIVLANWTPDGFGGRLFRAVSAYVPPPAGLKPGVRWGTEAGLRELLGSGCEKIASEPATVRQYFLSIEHVVDVFARWFGPVARAIETLDAERAQALQKDVGSVFAGVNEASDGTLVANCDYLRTIAIRR